MGINSSEENEPNSNELNLQFLSRKMQDEIEYALDKSPETTKHFGAIRRVAVPTEEDWSVSLKCDRRMTSEDGESFKNEHSNSEGAILISNGDNLDIVLSGLHLELLDRKNSIVVVRKGDWRFLILMKGMPREGVDHIEKKLLQTPEAQIHHPDRKSSREAIEKLVRQTLIESRQMMTVRDQAILTLIALNREEQYALNYNIGSNDAWLREEKDGKGSKISEMLPPTNSPIHFIENKDGIRKKPNDPDLKKLYPPGEREGELWKYKTPKGFSSMQVRHHLDGSSEYLAIRIDHTQEEMPPQATLAIRNRGSHRNHLGTPFLKEDLFADRQPEWTTGERSPDTTLSTLMDPKLGPLEDRARASMAMIEASQGELGSKKIRKLEPPGRTTIDSPFQIFVEWSESTERQFQVFITRAMNGYVTGKYGSIQEAFEWNRNRQEAAQGFAQENRSQALKLLNSQALKLMQRCKEHNQLNIEVVLKIVRFVYRTFEGDGDGANAEVLRAPELSSSMRYVDRYLNEIASQAPDIQQEEWFNAWRAFIPRFEDEA